MSGIVGLFHRDGAPVDRSLVEMMARYLTFRGMDGWNAWCNGPVGFGHAMLRTTRDHPDEIQPAALEGGCWITADARLDRRDELKTKLQSAGRPISVDVPDSELILQAYSAWGRSCLKHLYGDFAFAVWDPRERRLFCARDHFGIKPFYYAEVGGLFLFSNTLNCLRTFPDVSDELNEASIADFLLLGLNCDNASTTFRQIHRLQPAHALSASENGIQITKYWSAPTDGRIHYQRAEDYLEHFRMLLRAAVADRMRADRIGILLSGGLDSSSLASVASELVAGSGKTSELLAYTTIQRSDLPDEDRTHAYQVAEHLSIPIRSIVVGRIRPFERWDEPEKSWPEPVDDPFLAGLFEQFGTIAAECRVALSGEGCDNLMHFQLWPYVKDLLRTKNWKCVATVLPKYVQQRSSLLPGIRRRVQGLFSNQSAVPEVPRWIKRDFARRVDLERRVKEGTNLPPVSPCHRILPDAHASLSLPQWTKLFEQENPGVTHCPVDVCHPYLDLRIVDYLLSLPPFPFFHHKTLLRETMKGRLPENIRLRPKTPLADDPAETQLEIHGWNWLDQMSWCEELSRYVDIDSLPSLKGEKNAMSIRSLMRPICLNFWLRTARRVRYNFCAESCYG